MSSQTPIDKFSLTVGILALAIAVGGATLGVTAHMKSDRPHKQVALTQKTLESINRAVVQQKQVATDKADDLEAKAAKIVAAAAPLPEITPEIITRAVLKNPEGFAEAVRAALLAKPEIFAEAAQAYQAKQERDAQAAILPKIKQFEDELFNSDSPFIGNPNGSKVVVEFFDYQCGYCRAAHEPIKQMVKADGDLKVILKDLPVLGPLSGVAARAAGAAKLQGKYVEFHNALMESPPKWDDETIIFDTAAKVGLDVEKLRKDMNDPKIQEAVQRDTDLAQKLEVRGTPNFISRSGALRGFGGPEHFAQFVNTIKQ